MHYEEDLLLLYDPGLLYLSNPYSFPTLPPPLLKSGKWVCFWLSMHVYSTTQQVIKGASKSTIELKV